MELGWIPPAELGAAEFWLDLAAVDVEGLVNFVFRGLTWSQGVFTLVMAFPNCNGKKIYVITLLTGLFEASVFLFAVG